MMNYLNDVHGVYNKVQRIYEVRSNYIHQGNGGEIFNEMDDVNELCVRAIWKMINPETNIDKLEEDCNNNCSYSYF